MKPIELTNEIPAPKKNRGSILLGLLLLMAGYWTTNQAILGYHKGIKIAAQYIITHDLAETGVIGKIDERVAYSTALKLDDCRQRLEDVRESIIDLPLGGPQNGK